MTDPAAEPGSYTPDAGTLKLIRDDAILYYEVEIKDEVDEAARTAVGLLAVRTANSGVAAISDPEASLREMIGGALAGYWLGRALIGTSETEVRYSTGPDDAEDRGRRMADMAQAVRPMSLYEILGSNARNYLDLHCGRLHQRGVEKGALEEQGGDTAVIFAASAGLAVAVVEHDTAL